VSVYAASLAEAFPRLTQAVEAVCGPTPWIVCSAGIEDLTDHVNAEGYESRICLMPEDLMQRIATVALSGTTEHAKHFLVARFGDRIEPAVLGRLLQRMDTVPWGTHRGHGAGHPDAALDAWAYLPLRTGARY
jgi:hypothetical protein